MGRRGKAATEMSQRLVAGQRSCSHSPTRRKFRKLPPFFVSFLKKKRSSTHQIILLAATSVGLLAATQMLSCVEKPVIAVFVN